MVLIIPEVVESSGDHSDFRQSFPSPQMQSERMAKLLTFKKKPFDTQLANGFINHGADFIDVDLKETEAREDAVIVSNVSFSYITLKSVAQQVFNIVANKESEKAVSFPVLRNASIKVPKGQIYALLGSSGCGKTTLLRCILGRLKPNSGEISVFGKNPTSGTTVGYMPQEMALYGEFTVEQTLQYFGHLAHLQREKLQQRIDFLIELLHLSTKTEDLRNKLVREISGGQKRRLSLASAVIHEPPLLILDEPTVGVDPILRLSIWTYLRNQCTQKHVTVIITTHYMEEARAADVVGFMRFGQLLVESNPATIIHNNNARSLEEAFLRICAIEDTKRRLSRQSRQGSIISNTVPPEKPTEKLHVQKAKEPKKVFDFMRCKTIFWKNIFKMTRNLFGLLLYCFLPAFNVVLFCGLVGNDPIRMPMAIVNSEQPPQLSGTFLSMLDTDIISPVVMSDLNSARDRVKSGTFCCYNKKTLHLSQNVNIRH